MSCFKKRNSLLHSSSVKESRSNFVIFLERDVKIFRSVYLGQQQNFLFVYQIQIICDQKRFSRLSKGGHFSTTSGLVTTCSRHALGKVCLQLGRERHSSRARPSPHATSSPSSVLLRKVPINEGYDVTTVEEMKTALLSNGGFHGVRVTIVTPCSVFSDQEQSKVTSLNKFNNFHHVNGNTIVWRAYGVGKGKDDDDLKFSKRCVILPK